MSDLSAEQINTVIALVMLILATAFCLYLGGKK